MKDIHEAVKRHHRLVEEKGYEVVMTSLVGSQNYELDIETSDVDTFSFVMPSFEDLAFAREPVSGEFEVEDGKCVYKDIRIALNLLKKTSPNSIEYFLSYYQYHNPKYEMILYSYLGNESYMNSMILCNHYHMLYAIEGMARQLTKRNMPAGKRYSHALRLSSMVDVFTSSIQVANLLLPLPRDLNDARVAKRNTEDYMCAYYDEECAKIAQKLSNVRANFVITDYLKKTEKEGIRLIELFQKDLMSTYLKQLMK